MPETTMEPVETTQEAPAQIQPDTLSKQMVQEWADSVDDPKTNPARDDRSAARETESGADDSSRTSDGQKEPSGRGRSDSTIDAAILRHATDLGYTEQEARAFGSEENLRIALAAQDRELLRIRGGQQRTDAPAGQQQAQEAASPAQQATALQSKDQTSPQAPAARGKLELKLDPNLVDPMVADAFKTMQDHYEQRIALMEGALREVIPMAQRAYMNVQTTTVREFDSAISDLGSAFKDILGDQATEDLDPGSAEWKARDQIFQAANKLAEAYQQSGRKVPKNKELVRRAAYAEFHDRIREAARTEVTQAIDRRRSEMTTPPTARSRKSSVDDKDHVQIAEDLAREHGIHFVPTDRSAGDGW